MNILQFPFCRSQFFHFMMPHYAVAVGRCIGIYNTFDECKEQILNYPNAKFKKFATVQEAQDYILKNGKPTNSVETSLRNLQIPDDSRLGFQSKRNISDNNLLEIIMEKLSRLEENLNQFRLSTNASLEDFKNRIVLIENSLALSHEKPAKRIKLDKMPGNQIDQTSFLKEDKGVNLMKRVKFDNMPDNQIDQTSFLKDDKGVVMVFTDGACEKNGKKGAKAGIGVWFNHGHSLNISSPLIGPATNNNAEIQAARVAINQASKAGLKRLCVHTDSQFLINCITSWINKWKKNDWKLINGGDVKNKVELVKLDNALQGLDCVEWKYVRGHVGVEGNEMADKLARNGAAQYKCNVTYSDYCDI